MARNPIQFGKGLSLSEFQEHYGTEEQCREAIVAWRWPTGFVCPACGCRKHAIVGKRRPYLCHGCRKQTSVIAGTVFENSMLPKNVKTILRALAHEKHTIREGDQTRTLTTVDLLFRMLAIKAMQGDIQANKFMDRFLDRQSPPSDNAGYLVVPEEMSLEEFAVRAHKLNSLAKPPVSLIELEELSET